MKFSEFMQDFVTNKDKSCFSFKQRHRTFHFVKQPVTCKVEILYMMVNEDIRSTYGVSLGANMHFAGIIVEHKALYSNTLNKNLHPLYFEEMEDVPALAICFERVFAETDAAVNTLLRSMERPKLSALQEQEAKDMAYYSILHEEILMPAIKGLNTSYNMNDAVIDCYTGTENWAERIAEKWLANNKESTLEEVAIREEAERLRQECLDNPEDDIHLYLSMLHAVNSQQNSMVEVDIRQVDGAEKTVWVKATAFLNEYDRSYDILPAMWPATIALPPNRHRNIGGISKKSITAIRSTKTGVLLWDKKTWEKSRNA